MLTNGTKCLKCGGGGLCVCSVMSSDACVSVEGWACAKSVLVSLSENQFKTVVIT